MRVWRALKALGTAVVRDGVYLLPNRPEFLGPLQAQSQEVGAFGGSAQILEVNARDEKQDIEFRQLFDRAPDYEKLMRGMVRTKKEMKKLDAASLSASLARLRREYEAIALQDFFPGAAREQTREALEELAAVANALLSPGEPHAVSGSIQRQAPERFRARIWATRARPWADRLASAWLIKRFIDPRAKFVWLKDPRDRPKRAVGFDFDGAQFTHIGAKVTFEVLLASFGLTSDPALERIATVIHYLDVGGVPVPEAAGLEAVLRGARAVLTDDDGLTAEASRLFDLLYAGYVTAA